MRKNVFVTLIDDKSTLQNIHPETEKCDIDEHEREFIANNWKILHKTSRCVIAKKEKDIAVVSI